MFQFTYDAANSRDEKFIHFFNTDREVELGFVQSGHQKTTACYGYGPVIRDHFLIHFVKKGKGRLYLHDMIYSIPAGYCFLIYPHQIAYYEADAEEPWEYYWLGICGFNAEKVLDAVGFAYDRFILPFKSKGIYEKIIQMTDMGFEHRYNDFSNYLRLGGLVRLALYDLMVDNRNCTGVDFIEAKKDTDGVIGKGIYEDYYVNVVSNIIRNSFMESIRVEKIAEKLHINRSYLSSIYKRYTGKSIKQYLTSYRIEQSKVLLRNEQKSVADIANSVGFDDPLHFSRVFKKQTNFSPSEYRKRR